MVPAAGWLIIGALARPRLRTAVPTIAAAAITAAALIWAVDWTSDTPLRVEVVAGIVLLLIGAAALNQVLDAGGLLTDRAVRMRAGARTVAASLIAGPIIGFGTYWFAHNYFYFGESLGESYAVFAVPGILGLMLLSNTTFLGLASSELTDAALEWWNRFAAWLSIAGILWMAAGVLVFYLADLVEMAVQAAGAALQLDHPTSSTLVTILIPLISSLAGLAARTGGVAGRPSRLRLILQRIALPLTIVVLLATVAWFNAWALRGFTPPDPSRAERAAGRRAQVRCVFTRPGTAREPVRARQPFLTPWHVPPATRAERFSVPRMPIESRTPSRDSIPRTTCGSTICRTCVRCR